MERAAATAPGRGLVLAVALLAAVAPPAHGESALGVVPPNGIVVFDTAAPSALTFHPISGLGPNETVRGADVRPADGHVYAVTVTTGSAAGSALRTYRIDPSTGWAPADGGTAAPLPGGADVPTGWEVDPVTDRLRYVNAHDENARLLSKSGALAADDPNLSPAGTAAVVAAAHDRNRAGADATTLFAINRQTSRLVRQGGPDGAPSADGGALTDIGPLGLSLSPSADAGFDVAPGGTAYAAMTDAADGLTRLYAVDLANGAATPIGPIGNGATEVRALTILPDALPPPPGPPSPPPADAETSSPLAGLPTIGTVDGTPPVVASLALRPQAFRAAPSGPALRAAAAVGTRITFTSTEAARTRFVVDRRGRGRRLGGRCVAPARSPGGRRCGRWVRVRGSFTHRTRAGPNAMRFLGRVGGRRLRPGAHRLTVVASDADGNRATAVRKRFRIVGG